MWVYSLYSMILGVDCIGLIGNPYTYYTSFSTFFLNRKKIFGFSGTQKSPLLYIFICNKCKDYIIVVKKCI